MLIPFCLGLALVLPFAIWLAWISTTKTTYEGSAHLVYFVPSGQRSKSYAHIEVSDRLVPHRAGMIMVDKARYLAQNRYLGRPLQVVQKQRLFSKPWIEKVKWHDGQTDIGEPHFFDSLLLGMYYMCLGMTSVVLTVGLDSALPFNSLFCGLAIFMSGVSLSLFRYKAGTFRATGIPQATFLGGYGPVVWTIAVVILTCATILCFYQFSVLMLIPGLNCAFELGGLSALLTAWAWRKN